MSRNNGVVLGVLLLAAGGMGCGDSSPTGPAGDWVTAPSEFERLSLFVRNTEEYAQLEMRQSNGEITFTIFKPSQPGVPRVLIDSIGPSTQDPAEMADLLYRYNVWAMADSNAAGAACSTKTGEWVCNITSNDYSLVIGARRGGISRAQRYTSLEDLGAHGAARRLADHVFAIARKRGVSLR